MGVEAMLDGGHKVDTWMEPHALDPKVLIIVIGARNVARRLPFESIESLTQMGAMLEFVYILPLATFGAEKKRMTLTYETPEHAYRIAWIIKRAIDKMDEDDDEGKVKIDVPVF